MVYRLVSAAALLLLLVAADNAHAHHLDDQIRQEAVAHGVDPELLLAVAYCEAGVGPGGELDPYAVGDGGRSHGLFQLHERGLLDHFYALGYTTPYSALESARYAARVFSGEFSHLGIGPSHWTCYRLLAGGSYGPSAL